MNKPTLGTAAASSGAAAAIVTILIWLAGQFGITIPADVGAAMGTLIGSIIHWFMPVAIGRATSDASAASTAPTSSTASALLVVAMLGAAALGLSACSNAPQSINDGITTANTDVATLNQKYLGNACAVLALAHDGFQIASDLSPDVAANKPVEAQVYAALIGPTGLCSAASIANPPSDVAAALKAAYAQIAAFIPNLPQLPAPPASVAPVAPTAPAS